MKGLVIQLCYMYGVFIACYLAGYAIGYMLAVLWKAFL